MDLHESERSLTAVAIEFSVNKSTVSRVFAAAIEEGILDDRHVITSYGRKYLNEFRTKVEQMVEYLSSIGLDRKTARNDAFQIMGVCSEDTIQCLIDKVY